MAAENYGTGVAPFKRAIKSIQLFDGTGTPVTKDIFTFDGMLMTKAARRLSQEVMWNGRRPTQGAMAIETDDQSQELSLRFGLLSWVGDTAHTPREFMEGITVNAIALTSTGSGVGRYLFGATFTYDNSAENQGGSSQTATFGALELLSYEEEEENGLSYLNCTLRHHENAPTFA